MKKFLVIAIILLGVTLTGCTYEPTTNSYQDDQKKVEETQQRVQDSVPIPKIQTSAERKNIAARAVLFDNENKVTYIYLVSFGKVMAFYPVLGKVSSLNSYVTPVDKLVKYDGSTCTYGYSQSCYVVGAPDVDGAYGENADGIFFFTADTGAYVEWVGDYLVSDQPLKLTTAVDLVRTIE